MFLISCLVLGFFVAVPLTIGTVTYYRYRWIKYTEILALSLIGLSLLFLPWTQISLADEIGITLAQDLMPFLEGAAGIGGLFGKLKWLETALGYFGIVDMLLSPPGILIFPIITMFSGWAGIVLSGLLVACASILLLLTYVNLYIVDKKLQFTSRVLGVLCAMLIIFTLPEIDSLGDISSENYARSIALTVGLVGLKVAWVGPLTSLLGLGLLIVGSYQDQRSEQNGTYEEEDFEWVDYDGIA